MADTAYERFKKDQELIARTLKSGMDIVGVVTPDKM